MLRIYDDTIRAIGTMRPMIQAIAREDGDLANQLRRAASSVALNLAEGCGSFGGMRRSRYRTALGSARETLACLQTAQAFGYIGRIDETLLRDINRIIGTLVRVAA